MDKVLKHSWRELPAPLSKAQENMFDISNMNGE